MARKSRSSRSTRVMVIVHDGAFIHVTTALLSKDDYFRWTRGRFPLEVIPPDVLRTLPVPNRLKYGWLFRLTDPAHFSKSLLDDIERRDPANWKYIEIVADRQSTWRGSPRFGGRPMRH